MQLTIIAVGGLIVNLIAAYLLHGDHEHDLNMRGAWLHVMGDALGSVTAIIAGILIVAFGWVWADAVTSVIDQFDNNFRRVESDQRIGQCSAGRNAFAHQCRGNRTGDLKTRKCEKRPRLARLDDNFRNGSLERSHRSSRRSVEQTPLLRKIRKNLHDEFGIDHLTIQMETPEDEKESLHYCFSGVNCFAPSDKSKV